MSEIIISVFGSNFKGSRNFFLSKLVKKHTDLNTSFSSLVLTSTIYELIFKYLYF